MIIRVMSPVVTAEFKNDGNEVVCVIENTPDVVTIMADEDTGRLSVPFASNGCAIIAREQEQVVFESDLSDNDGSPCGVVKVSIHAPMVGVALMRAGIGSNL